MTYTTEEYFTDGRWALLADGAVVATGTRDQCIQLLRDLTEGE